MGNKHFKYFNWQHTFKLITFIGKQKPMWTLIWQQHTGKVFKASPPFLSSALSLIDNRLFTVFCICISAAERNLGGAHRVRWIQTCWHVVISVSTTVLFSCSEFNSFISNSFSLFPSDSVFIETFLTLIFYYVRLNQNVIIVGAINTRDVWQIPSQNDGALYVGRRMCRRLHYSLGLARAPWVSQGNRVQSDHCGAWLLSPCVLERPPELQTGHL